MIPGLAPGVSRALLHILPIGSDVHPGEHDLGVVFRQGPRLVHELGDGPRPIIATRERGRAKGAVLVATILDLEQGTGSSV